MSIETPEQLAGLMAIGKIVAETLRLMKENIKAGMTTRELDKIGAEYLKKHGAKSAPQLTYGYPAVTCISINDEAAHGIPGNRVIQKGDLVKIDVSAELNGYYADAAITVGIPPLTKNQRRFIKVAQEALELAIDAAVAGQPVNAIGRAAEQYTKRHGYRVISELTAHGVGLALHEPPTIPHVYHPRFNQKLTSGLVVTVEPHITTGRGRLLTEDNGWVLRTTDGKPAANFEHTIVITEGKPLIVTA
jgi:methionyl aminopeptidase